MLELLLAAAVATDVAQPPGLKALSGLVGCWKGPGQVRGKDATSIIRGSWHLGGRYFMLQVRSIVPKSPYEAAIFYGAGEKPEAIGSAWTDTFGGLYQPSFGLGGLTDNGFSLDYHFPGAVYANRFTRVGKGWRWMIMEQKAGKPETVFARYDLTPTTCRGMTFTF